MPLTDLQRFRADLSGSDPEAFLAGQLRALHLAGRWMPEAVPQYLFAADWIPPRRFRADFAFPEAGLLIEVDGGGFVSGAHNRGAGFEADRARDAEALCHGWRVLRVTPRQVESGMAAGWIERLLRSHGRE